MERGTDWEHERARERWDELSRRRTVATQRLLAVTLGGVGLLALALALGDGVCFTTARGGLADCTAVVRPPFGAVLVALGVVSLTAGCWRYWRTLGG